MTDGGYTPAQAWAIQEGYARERVLREAETWIGTPYHHAASVKGSGVDCGTLLIEVYSNAGVIKRFSPRKYSRQFHLHRDEEWYKGYVETWASPVEDPRPGDLVLFKVGRLFAHGAIITQPGWPHVIHAMAREESVIPDDISQTSLKDAERIFYNPWRGPVT